MTMPVPKPTFDPVEYQRRLCPEEVLEAVDRPSVPPPDRFFRVAAGLGLWTPDEERTVRASPALQEYERQMIAQVGVIYPPGAEADIDLAKVVAAARAAIKRSRNPDAAAARPSIQTAPQAAPAAARERQL